MDKKKKWAIQCVQLFTEVSVLSAVFALIILRKYGGGAVHTGWWSLIILLGYVMNVALRETGSSVNLTMVLDAVFVLGAGAAGQFLLHVEDPSLLMRIYVSGAAAGTALHVAVITEDEPSRRSLMLYLDTLIITLCLLLALLPRGGGLLQACTCWCLAALAASAGAVVLYRTDVPRPETAGILLALAGGCGLAALAGRLLQGAGAAGMSGFLWIGGLLITAVRTAGHWLMEGLLWFLRLFPAAEPDMAGEMQPPEIAMQLEEILPEEMVPDSRWIGMIILAAVVILLLRLLHRYRGLRWIPGAGGGTRGDRPGRSRTEGFWRCFRRRLHERWQFEWKYLRGRNTAAGLFTFTERRFSGVLPGIQTAESQPGWLRRLPEQTGTEQPELYRSLAEILERQYYGGAACSADGAFCRQYRRAVRTDAGRLRAGKHRGDSG